MKRGAAGNAVRIERTDEHAIEVERIIMQIRETREAIVLLAYRACHELGSLTAAGFHAPIFAAGIDQNMPKICRRVCERLAWLELDEAANVAGGPCLTKFDGRTAGMIATDEDLMIARHTCRVVEAKSQSTKEMRTTRVGGRSA